MSNNLIFYSESDLIERLTYAAESRERDVIFLTGSATSNFKSQTRKGIPDVDGMIDLIRQEFSTKLAILSDLNTQLKKAPNRYQKAFQFLLGKRSQDLANLIIKKAVLNSHNEKIEFSKELLTDKFCESLEKDFQNWNLPPAIEALGKILVEYRPIFGKKILTSNFDPLLEISIDAAKGTHFRTVLSGDGSIANNSGYGSNVVHLHGYWYGSDTLHTPAQLLQPRKKLRNSLADLLNNCTVVVIGYGGWDDIFNQAIIEVVNNDISYPDIVWTFFEQDENRLLRKSGGLLQKLSPAISRSRVTLFKGIDCHLFLPKLLDSLKSSISQINEAPNEPSERSAQSDPQPSSESFQTPKPRVLERRIVQISSSDSPPRVDAWVGRENEFKSLKTIKSPVVLISGIGGQGKSALAATYVKYVTDQKDEFELWDWRDCKEQGDRLITQLSSIIERLSNGDIVSGDVEGQDVEALTDILFRILGTKRCLFVFDNIDHYIDLESLQPVSMLRVLLNKAATRQHASRFLFTCRPRIRVDEPGILPIHLKDGLSECETKNLFSLRGVDTRANLPHINETHRITAGHPLWLNLIAVQVAGNQTTLPKLLAAIKRGQAEATGSVSDPVAATLRDKEKAYLDPIWDSLKDKQRIILRTMAEMVRPETSARLCEYLNARMYPSQFDRHASVLISLNLIVVKPREGAADLYDLHPIVRDYIRGRFHRAEQAPYARAIILVLDSLIAQCRVLLDRDPTYETLGHWVQKVELNINQGEFESAINTLSDVSSYLLGGGYPEEYMRVSRMLFESVDWRKEFQNGGKIDDVFSSFVEVLIQFGEDQNVENYLSKYEQVIPGKSSQYINLCNLRCYQYWYTKEFNKAVHWGDIGKNLKDSTKADVRYSTNHNWALAKRDRGDLEEALKFFLNGNSLEDALNTPITSKDSNPSFYGNIGRCLQFQGRLELALDFYKKSALLLERSGIESLKRLNQGYVRFWVGEVFLARDLHREALFCFKAADAIWSEVSPPRAVEAKKGGAQAREKVPEIENSIEEVNFVEAENGFKRWVFGKKI